MPGVLLLLQQALLSLSSLNITLLFFRSSPAMLLFLFFVSGVLVASLSRSVVVAFLVTPGSSTMARARISVISSLHSLFRSTCAAHSRVSCCKGRLLRKQCLQQQQRQQCQQNADWNAKKCDVERGTGTRCTLSLSFLFALSLSHQPSTEQAMMQANSQLVGRGRQRQEREQREEAKGTLGSDCSFGISPCLPLSFSLLSSLMLYWADAVLCVAWPHRPSSLLVSVCFTLAFPLLLSFSVASFANPSLSPCLASSLSRLPSRFLSPSLLCV